MRNVKLTHTAVIQMLLFVITGVKLGHMNNALVGVLLLQCIQNQRVHSSYEQVI